MIVAETGSGYRFVTQPAHAALAGRFADRWGGGPFEPPEPAPAVATSTHLHDDGWSARDRRPVRREDGTPEGFREVPPEPWITMYEEGIDAAVELEPYAGLLVSMHGTGLRRKRYGLSPAWPATPEAFADFVDRQEARQVRLVEALLDDPGSGVAEEDRALLASLHETGEPPEGTDAVLWRNYVLLQAWDTLSLSFCETVSPPAFEEVGPVPTGGSGEDETLAVEALEDGTFGVEPYPFDDEPLVATIPTRTVDRRTFDDGAELVRAYYESSREETEVVLRHVDG